MSKKGRDLCIQFQAKYKLMARGKAEKAEVLTLPRLALAFPVHSCMYMDWRISWPVMPHGLTLGRRSIACQSLGALIPIGAAISMDELIRAHAWFQYKLPMLINEKKFDEMTVSERKEDSKIHHGVHEITIPYVN